jgi:hypothetical protein
VADRLRIARFWWVWTGVNALAELFGLGATAAVVVTLAPLMDGAPLAVGLVLSMLVAVAGGAFEGLAVGIAQGWVLRTTLPRFRVWPWALATAVGAFIAWALGMLPSTIIGASQGAQAASAAGPPPELFNGPMVYLLAAAMGVVLGPVLAVPQWFVLRRFLPRAGWWIPANCLAWALGMPLVFLAADKVPPGISAPGLALAVGGILLLTGAVVGSVHGYVLASMVEAAGYRHAAPTGLHSPGAGDTPAGGDARWQHRTASSR